MPSGAKKITDFIIMKKGFKGFTLIELLVVIAIIGILASVVLASLSSARNKGADAATKSNMASIRAQAEIFNDTNNSYAGVCSDPTVAQARAGALSSSGVATTCNDAATVWAAEATLKSGGFWCIDSLGMAKTATSTIGSATACN